MTGRRGLTRPSTWPWWARLVVAAFAVLLALRVAAAIALPGLQPADAGEFQLVVRELGVAHPPGYPLYTIAGHVFGRVVTLPAVLSLLGRPEWLLSGDGIGADAWTWATNAFSAALALATLALTYLLARRLTDSVAGGLIAAVALALTPTFTAQSVVANIRMPTAFLAALLLWLAVRWLDRERGRPGPTATSDTPRGVDRGMVAVCFAAGLAVGHHTSLLVLVGLVAIVVLARRPAGLRQARTLLACAGALVVSLLPILYLPIRDAAGAPYSTGTLGTMRGLLEHVTGYGFRGDALYVGSATEMLDRLLVLWNILTVQFSPWLLLVALVGLAWLLLRRPLDGLLIGGSFVGLSFLAMTYRAPQTMEYLLPAYLCVAACVACGALALVRVLETSIVRAWGDKPEDDGPREDRLAADQGVSAAWLGALALILVLLTGARYVRTDEQPRRLFWAAAIWPQPALVAPVLPPYEPVTRVLQPDCLGDGGTILASWHHATPLTYAAKHIVPRPDVTIAYVHPEGAEPIGETWRRRVAETGGTVVATNRTREMIDGDNALWPIDGSAFYGAEPDVCPPPYDVVAHDVVFGNAVRLESANGADSAEVVASFRATRPVTETLTVFAQLIDRATGQVWGQVDHSFGAARWSDPRGLVDRLRIAPYVGARCASSDVVLGIYRTTPLGPARLETDGGDTATVGWWGLDEPLEPGAFVRRNGDPFCPPPEAPAAVGIPYGGEIVLAASDVRRAGGELVVDLDWTVDRLEPGSDLIVSVQAHGDGWRAQHDGVPAMGAIPTLKWFQGIEVRDRHRIELPDDLPEDAAYTVTVGVYDAFNMEPLQVTDPERVQRGEGQAAVIHRSE